jgi:Secretion system C-terminal sorting domain
MQKSVSIAFSTLCLLLVIGFSAPSNSPRAISRQLPPQPTGTEVRGESEDNEGDRSKFEAWYENLHRVKPGTDWRAIDRNTRMQKYASRKASGMNKVNAIDTLANGNLIGEWRERGSRNISGRSHVACMDTTAGIIYVGSDGGNVWRGNSNGTNWVSLNDDMQFDGISLIKQIPHAGGTRLLTGTTGRQFWYSDDSGDTWNIGSGLTNVESWGWIPRTVVVNDVAKTIYLLAVGWDYINWNAMTTIYRSTDHGTTFNAVMSWGEPAEGNSDLFAIWTPIMGDTTTYFLHSGTVYTLNPATGIPDSLSSLSLNNDGRTLLTGQVIGGVTHLFAYVDQDIYHSSDGGMTWTFKVDIDKNPFFRTSFNASLTQAGSLWFGDVECHRSTDFGATWTHVSDWWAYYPTPGTRLHADIPSIEPFIDAGGQEKQFISTDGGLYISDDGVNTVSNLSLDGLNTGQYYSSYTHRNDPDYLYVGSQDQGFQRGNMDAGGFLSLTQVISGDYGHIISSNGGTSIWMVYPGFADYYPYAPTGNSVGQWNFINVPLWIPPLLAHPTNPDECYLAGGYLTTSGSHILHLNHSGSSVSAVELPYDFDGPSSGGVISAMEISPLDNDHWYVLTDNGKFFHSSDGGNAFSITSGLDGPESHYFYGSNVYASRFDAGTVYIAGSGYNNPGFFRSEDHGQTFTQAIDGLPTTLIYGIAANADESLIFAATEVGPYVYVVAEDKWYDMAGSGAPDQTYWAVDYIPATNTARFCTYGRGVWDFAITYPFVTARPEPQSEIAITAFPNPATDFVQFFLKKPSVSQVTLTWRDVNGSVIRSSNHNIQQSQGMIYQDVQGLPAGIYFCEFRSGTWKESKKVLITR